MTALFCHISCQSGKWQGFVSLSDKVALLFHTQTSSDRQNRIRLDTVELA